VRWHQDEQIAQLWQVIEKLAAGQSPADCVPPHHTSADGDGFDAQKLSNLVGK
jgi:hypothetical protein